MSAAGTVAALGLGRNLFAKIEADQKAHYEAARRGQADDYQQGYIDALEQFKRDLEPILHVYMADLYKESQNNLRACINVTKLHCEPIEIIPSLKSYKVSFPKLMLTLEMHPKEPVFKIYEKPKVEVRNGNKPQVK